MTTKFQLAEQILRVLNGGDVSRDSSITYQEVALAVSQARDKFVREDIWARKAVGDDSINAEYLSRYCLDLECDLKTDEYYVTLPARPINLERNKGVYRVSYIGDQSNSFVPGSTGALSLYTGLDAEVPSGRKVYYVEEDKIYFTGVKKKDGLKQILVVMIASSSEIDDEDPFPVPADKELDIVDFVIRLYAPQKAQPEDVINDNVDQ